MKTSLLNGLFSQYVTLVISWWIGITVEWVWTCSWGAIGDAVYGLCLEVDEDWWLLVLFIGDAVHGWGLELGDVWSLLKVLEYVDAVDGWGL